LSHATTSALKFKRYILFSTFFQSKTEHFGAGRLYVLKMTDRRVLRIVAAVSFIPASALCIAHGILSNNPVPAVGLVPLFFSASLSIFLLSRHAKKNKQKQRSHDAETDVEEAISEGQHSSEGGPEEEHSHSEHGEPTTTTLTHPILVFFIDVILAAALMVVLVFTWIRDSESRTPELAMLAAYATMPLLLNL